MVKAKFRVTRKTSHLSPSGDPFGAVQLDPVGGDPGLLNAVYAPLVITDPAAFSQFELGKTYVLSFALGDDKEEPK